MTPPFLRRAPPQRSGAWALARMESHGKGADPTDYSISPTARSFVPYYSQRLSSTCVMHGARSIQKSIKRKAAKRRSAAVVE